MKYAQLQQVRPLGRRLHQSELHAEPEAVNSDTVYVTLQINAGANFRTQAVMADVQSALSPGGPYSVVPVQVVVKISYCNGLHISFRSRLCESKS